MKQEKPKEMLTVTSENGKQVLRINSSSLEIIQSCKRKAYYALEKGYRSESEREALLFGKAIHKALEQWYHTVPELRDEDASIRAFQEAGQRLSTLVDPTDKRSLANGEKILRAYFETYRNDPWVIYQDKEGNFTERSFEFVLDETPEEKIIYFGTIDAAFVHLETQEICLVDHKTTSALGQEFHSRIRPNHQFTGYLLGAQSLGIPVKSMMVNGIQVAKTKQQFTRQIVAYTPDDISEFKNTVLDTAEDYLMRRLKIRKMHHREEEEFFPMSAPSPCVVYGGCQYRTVCESPCNFRQSVLDSLYPNRSTV